MCNTDVVEFCHKGKNIMSVNTSFRPKENDYINICNITYKVICYCYAVDDEINYKKVRCIVDLERA